MHEGASIKSHIAEFSSIINDLDKIKIEDKDQAVLLLCSLPSSYKSCAQYKSTYTWYSQLMIRISRFILCIIDWLANKK